MSKPIVAIVGRPNVGKSTFFNSVTRTRGALVENFPGVTRDRHYGDATWDGVDFTLVDTGGFTTDRADELAQDVRYQVSQAVAEADAIVFMLDGKGGLSPFDHDLIAILRVQTRPVLVAVNKIDGAEQEVNLFEFYGLGIDKIYPLSAEHRYGLSDLLDDLVTRLPQRVESAGPDLIRVAVVGRPNVGKSSLINRILGERRLVVSDIPGTTRDAVDSVCRCDGQDYLLIDTAGIRRKGKVFRKLEKFSVIKALRSLDRCDVALILIDAQEGITDQDVNVAGYAYERGCGCIFVLNKWDLVEKDTRTVRVYEEQLRQAAKFLQFAPILTISALSGQRVSKIFKLVQEVYGQYCQRINTGQLNKVLELATEKNEPALHQGRRIKFYFATQASTKPPTFIFFVNYPAAVHFSYQRYLANQIREASGLERTPIRLIFRQRGSKTESAKPKTSRRTGGRRPSRRH